MNSERRRNEREQLRARLSLLVDEIDTVVQGLIHNYQDDGLVVLAAPDDGQMMEMDHGQGLQHDQQMQQPWELDPPMPEQHLEIGPQLPDAWELVPYQPPPQWDQVAHVEQQPQQQQQQHYHHQQQQQQQQGAWDEGWEEQLSPNALAQIQDEADGLRQDLTFWLDEGTTAGILDPLQPHPQQQQQQPVQGWETPRTHFERPVPQRTPSPSGDAPVALIRELNFSDQCLLCMGEHGLDCEVTVRGNNCGCVTICDTCCENGWWTMYAEAAREQAARQLEDSLDPWTGLVRLDEDSQRRWVEGHDARPKCLGCQTSRIDYLVGVTRPRRSQRTRKTTRCAFC
ncbi:hypothetical protein niasHS_009135 [Heterodera schachtii]|uniref:Uncharacterized protein n=1 Tax=Heterodera schachtii TaxID=97005 RepID=A0ABD2JDZ5_HETSC